MSISTFYHFHLLDVLHSCITLLHNPIRHVLSFGIQFFVHFLIHSLMHSCHCSLRCPRCFLYFSSLFSLFSLCSSFHAFFFCATPCCTSAFLRYVYLPPFFLPLDMPNSFSDVTLITFPHSFNIYLSSQFFACFNLLVNVSLVPSSFSHHHFIFGSSLTAFFVLTFIFCTATTSWCFTYSRYHFKVTELHQVTKGCSQFVCICHRLCRCFM